MAKGLSKRKQKRNKGLPIKDLQKLTDTKNVKNIKKRNKRGDKKALKQFRFSELFSKIQELNEQKGNQEELDEDPDEKLEDWQKLPNKIESADISGSVSEDEIRNTPTIEKSTTVPEEPRVVDVDVKLTNEDNDVEYLAANENNQSIYGMLLMRNSMEAAVHGKFQIEVMKGRVTILGYDISPKQGQTNAFSSKLLGTLAIKESSCEKGPIMLDEAKCEQLEEVFGDDWSGIKMKMETYCTVALFRSLVLLELDFICTFKPYSSLFIHPPKVEVKTVLQKGIINVASWRAATDEILKGLSLVQDISPFHVLLCGNKNTGKSTFARYLINTILSRSQRPVFFLECDVGQTEFTPPGIISLSRVDKPLLGPPFTHQRNPVASLFFGNNTSKHEPARYIGCIEEIFQLYMRYHRSEGPLVINTQGWVKGLGLSLLADVIRIIEPTFVIQLTTPHDTERGFTQLTHDAVQSLPGWVIRPRSASHDKMPQFKAPAQFLVVETPSRRSAEHQQFKSVDYRKLSLLAHLSHLFTDGGMDSINQTSAIEKPINCLVPRIVYWKDVAVHVMHSKVPPSLILAAVNYSLVSLSIVHPSMIIELSQGVLPDGPKFLRYNPVASHIGYGFIRNIDIGRKAFIILTPVPYDRLVDINALLKGNIDAPLELFHKDKVKSERLYYTPSNNTVIRGARARKPRFNLKRRKFLSSSVTP